MTVAALSLCRRCGCPATVHEHYRVGEDCGRCGKHVCRAFVRTRAGQRAGSRRAAEIAALEKSLAAGYPDPTPWDQAPSRGGPNPLTAALAIGVVCAPLWIGVLRLLT